MESRLWSKYSYPVYIVCSVSQQLLSPHLILSRVYLEQGELSTGFIERRARLVVEERWGSPVSKGYGTYL